MTGSAGSILSIRGVSKSFIGTMGDLFQAIETGGEPTISGEDNLKTLQLVFGCYKAAAERRAVRPSEIASPQADSRSPYK